MNDNPYESPASDVGQPSVVLPESDASSSLLNFGWWSVALSCVAWCFAYFAGWDAATGSPPHLQVIVIASISSVWIYYDAKRNGISMVGAIQFLLFFAWMIAVPVYLIYTRRKLGVAWAAVQVFAICSSWYTGWALH